jgi:hypothetical protein
MKKKYLHKWNGAQTIRTAIFQVNLFQSIIIDDKKVRKLLYCCGDFGEFHTVVYGKMHVTINK